MKKISIELSGNNVEVEAGISIRELAEKHYSGRTPVMAASVNNSLKELDFRLEDTASVEYVNYSSKIGRNIYRNTLSFILYMAIAELYYNTRIVISHSISGGFYFDFYMDIPINQTILSEIKDKMDEIISRNIPFKKSTLPVKEAVEFFRKMAMRDKMRLLEHSDLEEVTIVECGKFADICSGPLTPSTGDVSLFDLKSYSPGFILQFPNQKDFKIRRSVGKHSKLFNIYKESKTWGEILGVNNVGRLNQIIREEGISELVKIAESLHEKKIANIADMIAENRRDIRFVLIAGPSAAGKTTFSKRLATHLRVNGIRPVTVSVDNYFVNREDCPKDASGEYDFEALEAVNLELFNQHMLDLKNGREIEMPKFNFETGKSIPGHAGLSLEEDQLVIAEGIHCLNDKLTASIPSDNKFKIFISALTQLSVDDHTRLSTTDTRILRRMIRDNQFRNYTPAETLNRFPSVTRGEKRNIFPFQESADVLFNSALVYELALLKKRAAPLLHSIPEDDKSYVEAQRLLGFLDFFLPAETSEMPPTSILREFLGGSSFKY